MRAKNLAKLLGRHELRVSQAVPVHPLISPSFVKLQPLHAQFK